MTKEYMRVLISPEIHYIAKVAAAKAGVTLLEFTERALAAEARRVEWQRGQPKRDWHDEENRLERMME